MAIEAKTNLKNITKIIEYLSSIETPSLEAELPEMDVASKIGLCTEGNIYLIIKLAEQLCYTNPTIDLLKENKYRIDEYGNVLNEKEEKKVLSEKEVLELLKALEKRQFQAIFQYTKFKNAITQEAMLIDYLSQVKIFEINMTSSLENPKYEFTLKWTINKTKEQYREQKDIKVKDLISSFLQNLSVFYWAAIKKFQLTNGEKNYFLKKARELEVDFYSLSLEEQQTLLETWLIDYRNSNKNNIRKAQKAILTLEKKPEEKDINDILAGLLILYGRILLKEERMDYDAISLSGVDILAYDSKSVQEKKEQVAKWQEKIDANHFKIEKNALEPEIQRVILEKQKLDANLREQIVSEKLELATNNNLKMQILCENMEEGIVIINGKNKKISIRNTNPNTGKTTFEAHIPLEEMYEIMKCIEGKLTPLNYGLN